MYDNKFKTISNLFEENELVSNTNQLKIRAQDGKLMQTDVLDTKGILRLIESILSKNAEPMKIWLASVGSGV